MIDLLDDLLNTIHSALHAVRERLRPNCRRVILRMVIFGVQTRTRCGEISEWGCDSGYCGDCCHQHCHCGSCGCDGGEGEVVYDALKPKKAERMPS